jgi:hypothetical protein
MGEIGVRAISESAWAMRSPRNSARLAEQFRRRFGIEKLIQDWHHPLIHVFVIMQSMDLFVLQNNVLYDKVNSDLIYHKSAAGFLQLMRRWQ